MKTPREILLAQHCTTKPRLDELRRMVVERELSRQESKAQSWKTSFKAWFREIPDIIWRELIFPCRRIATGLAIIWITIAAINISLRDPSPTPIEKSSSSSRMMAFRDRRDLLSVLLDDRTAPLSAEPPKSLSPKPRTEITETKTA